MRLIEIYNHFTYNAIFLDDMYDVYNFTANVTPGEFEFPNSSVFNIHNAYRLFEWYKNGNRNDSSILTYFPIYAINMNEHKPHFNSNYGFYLFKQDNIGKCIDVLLNNIHSRRATIMINNNKVAFSDDTDKLCTNSISFRVINNKLNMFVHMRSNNFIDNMLYDMYTFHAIYQIVFNALKNNKYRSLQVGTYHHSVISMHVQKDQYELLLNLKESFINTSKHYFIRPL